MHEARGAWTERKTMNDVLMGLDLGTSSIKGVLMAGTGEILAQEQVRTSVFRPEPGHAEFSAEEHYADVCGLIRSLGGKIPEGSNVKALSMAAASGNTLLADRNGKPLTAVISWMDRRVKDTIKRYLPGFDVQGVHEVVGWPFSGMMSLAHLSWMKKERPDVYSDAAHVCMNSDYIMHNLTGVWGMDYSTATTFYLQDQVTGEHYKPYLDILDIDNEKLSPLMRSGTVLGPLTEQAAHDTGLDKDTAAVLGAFDHPCAARATGSVKPGDLLMSCGTSWVGFFPVNDRNLALSQNLLVDPFLQPDGPWGAMFSLPCIGIAIDRYIDEILFDRDERDADRYSEFNALAEKAPPCAEGLVIDLQGNDDDVIRQGKIFKREFSRENICRAVMEGAAFLMRERITELADAGISASHITMVGGPAESSVWPQIVADVTGMEIRTGFGRAAGAIGAAILAGIGSGVFADLEQAYTSLTCDVQTVLPDPSAPYL